MNGSAAVIDRVHGPAKGRCLAVSHAGLVYAVAYDPTMAAGISAQTRNALAFLDRNLASAGSGKNALLQATVYLRDMSMKPEMDAVWRDWIAPPENWPLDATRVGTNSSMSLSNLTSSFSMIIWRRSVRAKRALSDSISFLSSSSKPPPE